MNPKQELQYWQELYNEICCENAKNTREIKQVIAEYYGIDNMAIDWVVTKLKELHLATNTTD